MTEPINKFQRKALAVYANGQFDDLETYNYKEECGDALLSFVLAELSNNEDCEDLDMAIRRIESGIEDLNIILQALEK